MSELLIRNVAVLDMTMHAVDKPVSARPFHSVSFRLEGSGAEFEIGGKSYRAEVGDLIYMPAGQPYHLRASRDRILAFNFELAGDPSPKPFALLRPSDPLSFRELFLELQRAYNGSAPGREPRILSVIYRILADMELEASLSRESESRRRISAAIDRMHRDFADPSLSVAALAALCRMSDTWFRRLFTEVCGKHPHAYLTDLRISRAAELLSSGVCSVADAAYLSGFSDAKYFSTVFSRRMGRSPFAFKKQKGL